MGDNSLSGFDCLRWEGYLSSVYRLLGFSFEKDLKALPYAVREPPEIPRFGCLEVVGPLDPRKRTDCPTLAVDGVANVLDYDVLVSDGDGASAEELIKASREKLLFLHLHGDNFEEMIKLPLGKNVVFTTQLLYPGALCLPALSDGHRALLIASKIAEVVYVTGFGEGEQDPRTKRTYVMPLKERKLKISEALFELQLSGGLTNLTFK